MSFRPRVVELFAGGGGAHVGIERAGCETVVAVERDAVACETLRANGVAVDCADVNTSWDRECGLVHILWASPPCQPYSRNGLKMGSDDVRDCWPATLAQIKRIRPIAVIVENVEGAPVEQWAQELRALYAHVAVWSLNAKNYGVAQSRPRVFVVASPLPLVQPKAQPRVSVIDVVPSIGDQWLRMEQVGNKTVPAWIRANQNTARAYAVDGLCPTLTTSGNVYVYPTDVGARKPVDRAKDNGGRRMSLEEAAAIMGFPAGWKFTGKVTEKWRQIGNAVPPPLARAVVRALLLGADQ